LSALIDLIGPPALLLASNFPRATLDEIEPRSETP
jgi:hypothetical protein